MPGWTSASEAQVSPRAEGDPSLDCAKIRRTHRTGPFGGGMGAVIGSQRMPNGFGGTCGVFGGPQAANDAGGIAGAGWGTGGSGASSAPNISSRSGGAGAKGACVITEYY
jgi:hypothetical protein